MFLIPLTCRVIFQVHHGSAGTGLRKTVPLHNGTAEEGPQSAVNLGSQRSAAGHDETGTASENGANRFEQDPVMMRRMALHN